MIPAPMHIGAFYFLSISAMLPSSSTMVLKGDGMTNDKQITDEVLRETEQGFKEIEEGKGVPLDKAELPIPGAHNKPIS